MIGKEFDELCIEKQKQEGITLIQSIKRVSSGAQTSCCVVVVEKATILMDHSIEYTCSCN